MIEHHISSSISSPDSTTIISSQTDKNTITLSLKSRKYRPNILSEAQSNILDTCTSFDNEGLIDWNRKEIRIAKKISESLDDPTDECSFAIEPYNDPTEESSFAIEPDNDPTEERLFAIEPDSDPTEESSFAIEPDNDHTEESPFAVEPDKDHTEDV